MKTENKKMVMPTIAPNFTEDDIREAGISFKMTLHVLDMIQVILPIYEKIFIPRLETKMYFNALINSALKLEKRLKSDFLSVNDSANELNIVQEDNDDVLEIIKTYCTITLNKKKMQKFRAILKEFNEQASEPDEDI